MRFRTLFEGLGAAILLFAPRLLFVLEPYRLDLYHSRLPVNSVAGGILLDVLVSGAFFAFLFARSQSKDNDRTSLLWLLLVLFVVRYLIGSFPLPDDKSLPGPRSLIFLKNHLPAIELVLGLAFLLAWWKRRPLYCGGIRACQLFLAVLGISAVWIVPELLYGAFHPEKVDAASFAHPPDTRRVSLHEKRIVWILFDELSFDMLFDHRPVDLSTPNLETLKNQSYFFTNIDPVGDKTEAILPSLFLGQKVSEIRSNFDGDLLLHEAGDSQWKAFDEQQTFFADAIRQGWTTGLVGYFNPYCRILPTVLDSCTWMSEENIGGHITPEISSWHNAVRPIERLLFPSSMKREPGRFEQHRQNYEEGNTESKKLLQDERIRFVFLHLGVPHPPGIYDRKTNTWSHGSYIDNLQLADRTVKELVNTIQASPSANSTTIILSSDHSWRTWMWRGDTVNWNSEDERVAARGFDPRPVLMIHLPGQTNRQDIKQSVDELKEHDIVEAMLQNEAFSGSDLEHVLATGN